MKNYFLSLFLLMASFTGYILFNRPGAFKEQALDAFGTIGQTIEDVTGLERKKSLSASPPYFTYLSGDILVSTRADSFRAQNGQSLRLEDEVLVTTNALAILALGANQYLRLAEDSQTVIKEKPHQGRGFTTLKLNSGSLLVDFFKSKNPIGIKISLSSGDLYSLDATFRVEKTGAKETRVAIDRGLVTFKTTQKKYSLKPGDGLLIKGNKVSIDSFAWVDQYPWEKNIKETLLVGTGKRARFKAPLLEKRDQIVRERQAQNQKKKIKSSAHISFKNSKVPAPKKPVTKTKDTPVKNLRSRASNLLKKVPFAGAKVKESAETIENFEKLQQERLKKLEKLDQ